MKAYEARNTRKGRLGAAQVVMRTEGDLYTGSTYAGQAKEVQTIFDTTTRQTIVNSEEYNIDNNIANGFATIVDDDTVETDYRDDSTYYGRDATDKMCLGVSQCVKDFPFFYSNSFYEADAMIGLARNHTMWISPNSDVNNEGPGFLAAAADININSFGTNFSK